MTGKTVESPSAEKRPTGRGRVLGKGLSALIKGADLPLVRTEGREVLEIPINDLVHDPKQPRKVFHQDKLEELAASIRDVGMLQPVLVRTLRHDEEPAPNHGGAGITDAPGAPLAEGRTAMDIPHAIPSLSPTAAPTRAASDSTQRYDNYRNKRYLVVAGERRVRAARLAGLTSVPALVCTFEETEALRVALLENIQRENLGPIEEAAAYRELLEAYGATQEELADMLGKNRSTVSNTLRLLTLEEELRALLEDGVLTRGHAKALLALPPGQERLRLARLCRSRGLSVREVERRAQGALAARQRSRRKRKPTRAQAVDTGKTPEIRALQARAEEHFGSPVVIECVKGGAGRISVTFYGEADLERLLAMMGLMTDLG